MKKQCWDDKSLEISFSRSQYVTILVKKSANREENGQSKSIQIWSYWIIYCMQVHKYHRKHSKYFCKVHAI